jgi:hypothetical protein
MMVMFSAGICWLPLSSALAEEPPPPEITSLEPAEIPSGTSVKVTGNDFPKSGEIMVRLTAVESRAAAKKADVTEVRPLPFSKDSKSFSFPGPSDLLLGRYTVEVVFTINEKQQQKAHGRIPRQKDQLRVLSDSLDKVKVTGIYPLALINPDGKKAVVNFKVLATPALTDT